MTRDRFKQAMFNPYFQTNYYLEETVSGKAEGKFLSFISKINIFKKRDKDDKNKKSYFK